MKAKIGSGLLLRQKHENIYEASHQKRDSTQTKNQKGYRLSDWLQIIGLATDYQTNKTIVKQLERSNHLNTPEKRQTRHII